MPLALCPGREDNPEPYLAHVLDWIERSEATIDT